MNRLERKPFLKKCHRKKFQSICKLFAFRFWAWTTRRRRHHLMKEQPDLDGAIAAALTLRLLLLVRPSRNFISASLYISASLNQQWDNIQPAVLPPPLPPAHPSSLIYPSHCSSFANLLFNLFTSRLLLHPTQHRVGQHQSVSVCHTFYKKKNIDSLYWADADGGSVPPISVKEVLNHDIFFNSLTLLPTVYKKK